MLLSLPNSKIAEQVILTHILLNKQGTETIFGRISAEMFYSSDYKIIYQAICDLKNNSIEINFDTVCNVLEVTNVKKNNIYDYSSLITELVNQSTKVAELESYVILLLEKYLRRKLILSIGKISKLAYDNSLSLENIFDQAELLYRRRTLAKIFKVTLDNFNNDMLLIINTLNDLYINKSMSTNDIAKLYETNNETIRNYLKLFKIDRRSLSDSIKLYVRSSA